MCYNCSFLFYSLILATFILSFLSLNIYSVCSFTTTACLLVSHKIISKPESCLLEFNFVASDTLRMYATHSLPYLNFCLGKHCFFLNPIFQGNKLNHSSISAQYIIY